MKLLLSDMRAWGSEFEATSFPGFPRHHTTTSFLHL